METSPDQRNSEEVEATLQLKRALLPIDEYAAREGLSRGIVEECGKLGVIQIRRYKGKTFVVDVPLSPYLCGSEAGEGAARPVDKGSRSANGLRNYAPDIRGTAKKFTKSNSESIRAGTVSGLVEKMFDEASQIADKPAKTLDDENNRAEKAHDISGVIHHKATESMDRRAGLADDARQVKSMSESVRIMPYASAESVGEPRLATDKINRREPRPESAWSSSVLIRAGKVSQLVIQMFRKAGRVIGRLTETARVKTKESKAGTKAEQAQIIEDNEIEFGVLPDGAYSTYFEESQNEALAGEVKSKRIWQVAALFSMVFLFAALFTNMWFYMDRRIQLDRLDQAYATIRSVYGDFIEAGQRADALQNELTNSRAEVGRINGELSSSRAEVTRIRNELGNSKAELRTVQNELTEARENLQAVQRRNAEAVAKLKGQIQRLTAWIKGATEGQ